MALPISLSELGVWTAQTAAVYPVRAELLPAGEITEGKYTIRFARALAELDELMRLRFAVFNLEMGEGLEESFRTGRDRDEFDDTCHHLIVTENITGAIVGTYRLRPLELAENNGGFYSAGEFDMSRLPPSFIEGAVEIGRACIARAHRNTKVLLLLWKGLVRYAEANDKRYFFGCGSLPGQNAHDGRLIYDLLKMQGHVHPTLRVEPQKGYECRPDASQAPSFNIKVPPLCETYLRFGSKIAGPPALDRQFKTIDYFVVCDLDAMEPRLRQMLVSSPKPQVPS
jgi:putative hemolysin